VRFKQPVKEGSSACHHNGNLTAYTIGPHVLTEMIALDEKKVAENDKADIGMSVVLPGNFV
jgi:hypothetical protein